MPEVSAGQTYESINTLPSYGSLYRYSLSNPECLNGLLVMGDWDGHCSFRSLYVTRFQVVYTRYPLW
jgi:hypothetical protein